MADLDLEPPSFSLGLDLDLDESEPQPSPRPDPAPLRRIIEEVEEEDDFESPFKVPGPQASGPPRPLKRLRRGPTSLKARNEQSLSESDVEDDDIEDFSSEEDKDLPRGNLPTHSVCSSSKPSLHVRRVLTSQDRNQQNSTKSKEISSASASVNGGTSGSNLVFPKLTASPLRRFQLIESDSDDPSASEDLVEEASHVDLHLKDKASNSSKQKLFSNRGTESASVSKSQTEDLWKDFSSEKNFSIPTPAFDEICEEYFSSRKRKSEAEVTHNDSSNGTECYSSSGPPSHCYFSHKDARIRNLVRERLPHFFPLGAGNNPGQKQEASSVIDYMGQFNHEGNSRQANRKGIVEKSSTRAKKNGKAPVDSENWVNPKTCAGLPKDAGKRRVQAVGKSGGHWYTGADGRRVYVNKNGQELTGQIAYRHYKKESGTGFKNSKKKTTAKQKTAGKRKSAPKKK